MVLISSQLQFCATTHFFRRAIKFHSFLMCHLKALDSMKHTHMKKTTNKWKQINKQMEEIFLDFSHTQQFQITKLWQKQLCKITRAHTHAKYPRFNKGSDVQNVAHCERNERRWFFSLLLSRWQKFHEKCVYNPFEVLLLHTKHIPTHTNTHSHRHNLLQQ